MKKLLVTVAMFLLTIDAFAYSSGVGTDPVNGTHEVMTRQYKKSTTAGVSDAISKGDILIYDSNNVDGYTLTRVGADNTLNTRRIACVAMDAVATGDTAYHRCVVKGYIDYLSFDATVAIVAGHSLCTNAVGAANVCAACQSGEVADSDNCRFGDATPDSGIISLEAKTSGTGTNLKAILKLQ